MTSVKSNSLPHIVAEKKKRKTKSLFPKSSTADNRGKAATQQDCIDLASFVFHVPGQFISHADFIVLLTHVYEHKLWK